MPEAVSASVRCLLIPLQGGRALLLPNAAIAEVLPYRGVLDELPDAEPWLLGMAEWRGQRIAVVAFEPLADAGAPVPSKGGQMIVLHGPGGAGPGYYALVASAIPHIFTVGDKTLQDVGEQPSGPVLREVTFGERAASVPDLEALEERLIAALASAG